ncbi:Ltp family lipoprotein [Adlercreutzia caecimuris]|uniref:Ltp family lipoprotein n=1 Tax=Adlercreutzia caecimuris TaxID=671266 RepID=UPI001C3EDCDF|nr:Ltp family lipoprotein [Adlercreutzia caecimuris]
MSRALKIAINCALVALLAAGIGSCTYINWADEQRKRAEFEELTKPHQNMVDAFNQGAEAVRSESAVEKESANSGESHDTGAEALALAFQYLESSPFSKDMLIKQLEYEGFSTEDATWAVDLCGADWNAEAVRTAQLYLSVRQTPRDELITYLENDLFTHDQAIYGADQALQD